MPSVRMLTNVAGPNHEWRVGDVVQMTPELAQIWADGIRGELVTERRVDTPERAQPAPERRGPGRPRKNPA